MSAVRFLLIDIGIGATALVSVLIASSRFVVRLCRPLTPTNRSPVLAADLVTGNRPDGSDFWRHPEETNTEFTEDET
jgi:hypothetical protein